MTEPCPQIRKFIDDIYEFFDDVNLVRGVDIGCGTKKIHPNAIGIDFDRQYNKPNMQQTEADIVCSWEDWISCIEDNSYDYVYAGHLIEDYEKPQEIYKQWMRIVCPEGFLCICSPVENEYRAYSIFNNEGINMAHKNFWSGAMHFFADVVYPNYNDINVELHDYGYVEPYSFYIIIQKV